MSGKYENEDEIRDLVRSFEEATISRGDWRHAEHLVVALYYLTLHDETTAANKMRDGIFKLLREAFAVDLTKEMPYHETLTVFWLGTIANLLASRNGASLVDNANELVAEFDKDYPLKFYTRELLFSDKARAEYLQPDL